MDNRKRTWSQRIADNGNYNDMREYQQLKTADEMEREATARLKEHLKKKTGSETAAEQIMRRKGYNPDLLQ